MTAPIFWSGFPRIKLTHIVVSLIKLRISRRKVSQIMYCIQIIKFVAILTNQYMELLSTRTKNHLWCNACLECGFESCSGLTKKYKICCFSAKRAAFKKSKDWLAWNQGFPVKSVPPPKKQTNKKRQIKEY